MAIAVFGVLAWAIIAELRQCNAHRRRRPEATVKQIGDALMTKFVLPLEVIGLLLTAALIGAVIIAMQEEARNEAPRSKFQAPKQIQVQISSEPGRAAIGVWNLKLLWNLELGIWSFPT